MFGVLKIGFQIVYTWYELNYEKKIQNPQTNKKQHEMSLQWTHVKMLTEVAYRQ